MEAVGILRCGWAELGHWLEDLGEAAGVFSQVHREWVEALATERMLGQS